MITYLLLLYAIACGVLLRKSKVVALSITILCVILMGFNTKNGDYQAYYVFYDNLQSLDDLSNRNIEPVFTVLAYCAKYRLGFDYQQFLIFYSAMALSMYAYLAIRYSGAPALVMALYLVAPFFPCDINQIRNCLANVILTLGLLKLTEKDDIVPYAIAVFIATLAHSSMIVYIVIVPAYLLKRRFDIRRILIIAALLAIITPISLRLMSTSAFANRVDLYAGATRIGFNYKSVLVVASYLIDIRIIAALQKECNSRDNVDREAEVLDITLYILRILCVIIIPMILLYSFNMYRYLRNILFFNYIVVSKHLPDEQNKYIFIVLLYMITGLVWSSMNMYSQWNEIASNNLLLGPLWVWI